MQVRNIVAVSLVAVLAGCSPSHNVEDSSSVDDIGNDHVPPVDSVLQLDSGTDAVSTTDMGAPSRDSGSVVVDTGIDTAEFDTDPGVRPTDSGISSVPICVHSCTTAADCQIGSPDGVWTARNFTCEAGACRHHGCSTDAQCVASFGATYNICR